MFTGQRYSAREILQQGPIIPVLNLGDNQKAYAVVESLLAAGIKVIEVTLRKPNALQILAELIKKFPQSIIGAGTVVNPTLLKACEEVGAQFAFSPGITQALLKAGKKSKVPLIPGISTVSEVMTAMDEGYQAFKLFPANAMNSLAFLKAIALVFPNIGFCPTGGIDEQNYLSYLKLKNVYCVGGSWLIPAAAIEKSQWKVIGNLTKAALERTSSVAI